MATTLPLTVSGDRKAIRKKLVDTFLQELPGKGSGDLCSKYLYVVEEIEDKRIIFLKRPAMLNKGFDFEVHVSNTIFFSKAGRRFSRPSHDNVLDDLALKQVENPIEIARVLLAIERIYNCELLTDEEYRAFIFQGGHSIEIILKSIKWLFIEQDLTYWNFSGRDMLFNAIRERLRLGGIP